MKATEKFNQDGIEVVGHEDINDEDQRLIETMNKAKMHIGTATSGRYPKGSSGNVSSSIPPATKNINTEQGSDMIFDARGSEVVYNEYMDIVKSGPKEIDSKSDMAVHRYIGSFYERINTYARHGQGDLSEYRTAKVKEDIEILDATFDKYGQPVPQGTELWRGIGVKSGSSVASMEVGDICEDKAFQSFSLDMTTAGNFARHWDVGDTNDPSREMTTGKTVIRAIMSGEEKVIRGSLTEREVIFKRGTKWQVISKDKMKVGRGTELNIVTVMHHG